MATVTTTPQQTEQDDTQRAIAAQVSFFTHQQHTSMDETFLNCLEPLNYFLIPIGITNLFPNREYPILIKIWSWLYLILLPFALYYMLAPGANAMTAADVGNIVYILMAILTDYVFTAIAINLFIRFYFLRNGYLQKLLQNLYEYIKQNSDDDELLNQYKDKIRRYCRNLVIFNFIFLFINFIVWMIVYAVTNVDKDPFVYTIPFWWTTQIYYNLCCGYIIFLIVLLILYYRYYVLSAKIYNSFLKDKVCIDQLKANDIMIKYLYLNELQTMKTAAIDINDIKSEYISLVLLFQNNAELWWYYWVFFIVNLICQVANGFILFFAYPQNWFSIFTAIYMFLSGVIFGIIYIVAIAKLNSISDQFKLMISLVNMDENESDNNGKSISELNLVEFIDIHICMFPVFYIHITWSLAIVLLTSVASPLISFVWFTIRGE